MTVARSSRTALIFVLMKDVRPALTNELLRCDAPGCHLTVSVLTGFGRLNLVIMSPQYHLPCQGLFDKSVGGWFCNNECQKNAGY